VARRNLARLPLRQENRSEGVPFISGQPTIREKGRKKQEDQTDEIGNPQRSVYYTVEVVARPARRRAKRISGVGDFRDLRQLSLIDGGRR